jgi:tetratricopeptide (TPR) repeat protein
VFNRKLIENCARSQSSSRISNRLLIIGVAFWLGTAAWSRAATAADLAQLRKQLATAEEANDKPATIELGRRIVALAPNDGATWDKVAQAQLEKEDYDRAKETLDAWEKAMKPPPAAIEDYRGDLDLKLKDEKGAEKHWLAFLARKPAPADAANIYDKLGDLCAGQKRWADCESYEAKAILAKDSAARRVAHATVLLRLRRWDAAYADMDKANKIDSTDAQVKEWLPKFERLKEVLGEIKDLDGRIAKSPNNATLWLDRARLLTMAERPLLALDDCDQALKLQPASMRARIQKAEALLDTSEPDEAEKLQVGSNLARDKDKHVSEQALRELGSADAEIAQNPAESLAARAKTLRGLKQTALALADAEAALKIDDKSAAAHLEAAHAFDTMKQSKEALLHATKASELNPNDGAAWAFRGDLEAQRANYPAAIESFTRSLKLEESLEVLRARENCERRIGKIAEADADLKRIGQLEPTRL